MFFCLRSIRPNQPIFPVLLLAITVMSSGCSSSTALGPSMHYLDESKNRVDIPSELAPCPSSPNCVSSVATDAKKQVAAFELNGAERDAFQAQLQAAIEADGGEVKTVRDGYLWATYTSRVFQFVDDIEWLFNAESNVFDVRSASRVGYSDLGVNAKRVERLRALLVSGSG